MGDVKSGLKHIFFFLIRTTQNLVMDACRTMNVIDSIQNIIQVPKPVFRVRLDPFHFGHPDPVSKTSAKIMENIHKNNQYISYHIFFSKSKFLFYGKKYLPHK